MTTLDLLHHYGYPAIVVGTFFEGEVIMLAAGIAASTGLLNIQGVILAGMAGIFASDTFCFLLGRFAGAKLQRWFPKIYARLDGVFHLIEKHDDKLIVYFQFFPGLCTVTPVAFGMTKIKIVRFMAFDLVGNAFWTLVFSFGGFIFGAAFVEAVHEAHRWMPALAAGIIALVAAGWWWRHTLSRRRSLPS